MHSRSLILTVIVAAAAGLLGARAGEEVESYERTRTRRIEHRDRMAATPAHRWGEDVYQTFHPGTAKNSVKGKNNLGARRWTLYKRTFGQIGGADRIVVYNNSPGDGIARSAVVYGVAPTNAGGDEGVELDLPEIWNFGNVPDGVLAERAAKGSEKLRVKLSRTDHARFLGEDQLVVLVGRSQAAKVRGMDPKTRIWHAEPGRGFSFDRSFDSFAFALGTSAYKDRTGAEVMDWLEAHPEGDATRLRTVHLAQGRDTGAPGWYSHEGKVAHFLRYAPGVREGYTAPAFRIVGLSVPTLASGRTGAGVVELVLDRPLPVALPRGEHVQMHSGGPPHATFLGHQLAYCRRGNHCYGNMLNAHYSTRPLAFAYASHSSGDLDFASGYAFDTTLRSRFSGSAVEHWYEADGRSYDRSHSTFGRLRAEQGWGKESFRLFDFLGRNTRLEYDSRAGVLRLVVNGQKFRLVMENEK
jgi:hypothetical protein